MFKKLLSVDRLSRWVSSPGISGFVFLLIFLATNGYIFGWDDQHLEIPLLQSLIDPSLYPGDYYISSLKAHFASLLYPWLARVISLDQIPSTYFWLYLISRALLFSGLFRLWSVVSGSRKQAFVVVWGLIVFLRVEEFLYRTFSHQELALGLIAWALALFYQNRFNRAGALLGFAANFHALYSSFPLIYICVDLLRQRRFRQIILCLSWFVLFSLPLILWIIQHRFLVSSPAENPSPQEWRTLYDLACPQNFFLGTAFASPIFSDPVRLGRALEPYLILMGLFLILKFFSPLFQKDKRTQTILATAAPLVLFSFIFDTLVPIRRILDLNLIRNVQFIHLFLAGYFLLLLQSFPATRIGWVTAGMTGLFLPLFRLGFPYHAEVLLTCAFLLTLSRTSPEKYPLRFRWLTAGCAILLIIIILHLWFHRPPRIILSFYGLNTGLIVLWMGVGWIFSRKTGRFFFRDGPLIIVLVSLTLNFMAYHHRRWQMEHSGTGFWQLQRNWIDMQNYARQNTPRSAVFLVPHDMEMGGFRIFSQRSIICSYRDCGVIGFDYSAAKEWKRRLDDIEAFQVYVRNPIGPALMKAIQKYKVNYIVFMRYLQPPETPLLQKIYENEAFALYRVLLNPLRQGAD